MINLPGRFFHNVCTLLRLLIQSIVSRKMSTSESLIADTENSIVNADSSIVVTENRIVVAESSVADADESEQQKLESKFGTKLDEDYDQREKSSASSFKLYLDMTIHVLNQNSLCLRDLIRLIEKRNYSKTKATLATSSLQNSSLKKNSFSKTSDFIFTMGNKILDFLRDAQMQKADQNLDYIGLLKSIPNEEDKERLKNSIEVLSQSDLLQDLNFPERIADEWLYLNVKRHKQGLLKIHEEVVDTIKTKATDPEIIDLTSEHFPAGVKVTDPQIQTIKKNFSRYKTQMGNSPSNSVSRKRPRIDSTAIVVKSSKRLADNSSRLNKPHCVVTKRKTSSVRKPGRKNQQGRPRKTQTVQIQAVEEFDVSDDNEDQIDDVDDQDNEDAHPEDVQQVDGVPDDNDDDIENSVVDTDVQQITIRRNPLVICSDDEDQEVNEDVHQPEGGEQDNDNDANIGDIEANIDEKEKQQDVDTPKCAYPDYSDDDEEFNDKESETSTRKRKRQSSVFSITKNCLREDFEDVLSSFECPLSSNEIIEIGKDLCLALRKRYLELPGSDIETFAMLLQASFEPVTNISNSSSTPQSQQGQPSESATSSVKASQPVTSSVAPAATNISNSSSTPQSKQASPPSPRHRL